MYDGILYEVNPIALASESNVSPDFRQLIERLLDSFAAPAEG